MEQHTTNGHAGQAHPPATAQARKDLARFAAVLRLVTELCELALELESPPADREED